MNEIEFAGLIKRYQEGVATKEEIAIVEKWLDAREASGDELSNEDITRILGQVEANLISKIRDDSTVVSISRNKILVRVAASVALLVAAVAGIWLLNLETKTERDALVDLKTIPAIATTYSGKQYVQLPDGSTALLNTDGQVTITNFNENERVVTASGEVYFDIAHNPDKPFKVITGKVTTTVLGTAFNIRTNKALSVVEVTVTRGKVQVADKDQVYGLLTPNQQLSINTKTNTFSQHSIDTVTTTAWLDGYMAFEDLEMEKVAAALEVKYRRNIVFKSEGIRKCKVTATLPKEESLANVLDVITSVFSGKYEILPNGDVQVEGRPCQ